MTKWLDKPDFTMVKSAPTAKSAVTNCYNSGLDRGDFTMVKSAPTAKSAVTNCYNSGLDKPDFTIVKSAPMLQRSIGAALQQQLRLLPCASQRKPSQAWHAVQGRSLVARTIPQRLR